MDLRRKIEGVEVIANAEEVWFLQEDRVCWATKDELWSSTTRLTEKLRGKGYKVHSQRFPKKLRELILNISRSTGSEG